MRFKAKTLRQYHTIIARILRSQIFRQMCENSRAYFRMFAEFSRKMAEKMQARYALRRLAVNCAALPIITMAVILGMTAFSFPASANVSADEVSVNDSVESKTPLTPKGNLTKIDDVHQVNDEDTVEDKQFITVQSKNGNTFYIIIDRSGDTENVYFLNAVDEADLMALMEDEDKSAVTATCTCTTKCEVGSVNADCTVCSKDKDKCASTSTATPAPTEETPAEEKQSSSASLIILVLFALAGAGGAFYWFKVKNKKSSTKGTTDPNDFYEEDEDYETEDEETETESEQDYEADESDDNGETTDEESEETNE